MADTVALESIIPGARFSFRIPPEGAKGIGSAAGFTFDSGINTCVSAGERLSIRLGPNEWLLLAPVADRESVRTEIERSLGAAFFSLVDVSDTSVAFAVRGNVAADVLNAGCALDLGDAAFPAGSATRTLLGKAEIILIRPNIERSYRVECLRSFGPYVHAFLNDAMLGSPAG